MTEISKRIIQKIMNEQMLPYPKRRFILKRAGIWIIYGLLILLGSLASGAIIFQLTHVEWNLYQHFDHSITEFLFIIIPYFWLFFLICFTILAYYYFRKTEKGYRYSTILLISGNILISVIGGVVLFTTTLSERFEMVFQRSVPLYMRIQECKQKIWMSPEQGLLAGTIIKNISKQEIQIKDMQGKIWMIDVSNTLWRGWLRPVKNLKIKLLGNMKGEYKFIANEIRPWQGRRQRER